MGNPCRDLAPSQPRATSRRIWRPSPATKLAFSGTRGGCASSCPVAADKFPDTQRPARRQRRHSIPIARHQPSGGSAQRDLLTTGRGATPSRASASARRDRQSKDGADHRPERDRQGRHADRAGRGNGLHHALRRRGTGDAGDEQPQAGWDGGAAGALRGGLSACVRVRPAAPLWLARSSAGVRPAPSPRR